MNKVKLSKPSLFLIVILCTMIFLPTLEASAYTEVFPGSRYYRYMQGIYKNHNSHYCQKIRILAINSYFRDRNSSLTKKTAQTYATLVERHSRINEVDPFLTAAVIVRESNVQRTANNANRSFGLMQINWTANESWIKEKFPKIKSPNDLYRSENNIQVGTCILGSNLKEQNGNVDRALDRYRGKSLLSYRRSVLSHYEEITRRFKKLKDGDLGFSINDFFHTIFK